jgi:hypothetical protein
MSASSQEETAEATLQAHREALLKEYGEVASNLRLLTDIRFKLLALLPIAAAAATALLSSGSGRDGAAEVRALGLSLFGLVVTVALATYNDRNDQHYDALVGRAASIEWQLGLSDGAFANRPASWFAVKLPIGRSWPIEHRTPIALIYGASVALWLFSASAAVVQLVWGDAQAPRGVLAAAIVPAIVLPTIVLAAVRKQRKRKAAQMRTDAAEATDLAVHRRLADLADDRSFLQICERLSGVKPEDAQARARFYSHLREGESRRFMPDEPEYLVAAHFVALITDLSPGGSTTARESAASSCPSTFGPSCGTPRVHSEQAFRRHATPPPDDVRRDPECGRRRSRSALADRRQRAGGASGT